MDLYADLDGLRRRQKVLSQIGASVRMVAAIGDRFALTLLGMTFNEANLIGAVTTEEEAIAVIETGKPDLLICTERLEQGYGINLIKRAEAIDRSIKSLLLLERATEEVVQEALSAYCDGLVNIKTIGEEDSEFPDAIDKILNGGIYYPPSVRRISEKSATQVDTKNVDLGLSQRETEVLREVCQGKTNKEIASSLYISVETVKTSIQALLVKLGARDRTHAAVMAIQRGFAPD